MTAQRSFKRLVRARMAKTGESYTTARARLLAAPAQERVAADVPRLACSDERIRERTGRGWEEWFELLDSWDAGSLEHTALTRRLAEVQGRPQLAWDVQAVASSYELTRGLRQVGQRVGADGWVAGASRTMCVSGEQALTAFVDPSRRAGWLPDVELHERVVHKPASARFDVGGGPSRLVVTTDERTPGRTTVAVQHTRLSGSEERQRWQRFWRQALTTLKAQLEADTSAEGRPA